jgi:hypothetical protein
LAVRTKAGAPSAKAAAPVCMRRRREGRALLCCDIGEISFMLPSPMVPV